MPDLSIIIPGRAEQFMAATVEDVLAHTGDQTEVIAVIDGEHKGPALPVHARLQVIELPQPIGQRAAQNAGVRIARGRYVMKLDAHCAVEPGFDAKLLAVMGDNLTIVPVMKNLHVFNWVCVHCGLPVYQGPKPDKCRSETCDYDEPHFQQEVCWIAKPSPNSSAYRFNKNLQFKYFDELKKLQGSTGLQDTMSLQGSCFMVSKEMYLRLNLADEAWGTPGVGWGQQGSEVALKTWLSGGRVACLMDTWYAHMFRTQDGFGHPYPGASSSQMRAREVSQDIFLNDKWPHQTRPLVWLLDKFWEPLSRVRRNEKDLDDWEHRWQKADLDRLRARPFTRGDGKPSKGIIFYTDGEMPPAIAEPVRDQIIRAAIKHGLPIVTAGLKRRVPWGDKNILFGKSQRSTLTMFRQILGALENSTADIIYFCEHDVLYHPSHFEFTPPDRTKVYYNFNWWQADAATGRAVRWDAARVSQLCGYRDVLIEHYRKRVALVEAHGYSTAMGYEPGTHHRAERVDDLKSDHWQSAVPNVDLRHGGNLSPGKWSLADFRNAPTGWQEADEVPGWENVLHLISGGENEEKQRLQD